MSFGNEDPGTGVAARAGRRGVGILAAGAWAACAVLAGAGCDVLDDLVGVEAPSQIDAEVFEEPENALRLLAGAVGDFECAFADYVVFQGAFTDELEFAQGSESWRAIDARDLSTSGFDAPHGSATCSNLHQGQVPGVYKTLSTARFEADHLIELVDGWTSEGLEVATPDFIRAKANAYSGYSHVLLGESMCEAAFDAGPILQPPQIFERAVSRFDAAVSTAQTIGDEQLEHLALLGRARARLNLGDVAGAAADAVQIPPGFRVEAGFSTISPRRENQLFVNNNRGESVTIEAPFRDLGDPRVAVEDQGRLSSRAIPVWHQLKYPDAGADIPVATWEEARLIVAEAELEAGNLQAAVAAINDVRAAAGLPPFQSSNADEIFEQLLFERKAELFLESHRLGDFRRYDLPLEPPPGEVYPHGGVYGDQECLPLPDIETNNNPNA